MTLTDHLPVLCVVVPLAAAPVTVLFPKGRLPWAWATLVSWATFILSMVLMVRVADAGVVTYNLGGWPSPFGIVYRIDIIGALVLALVSGMAALVLPYAKSSIRKELGDGQSPAVYAMLLICLAGLMGVVATGDAFNVFVFLEISSLSTYALVAMGAKNDRRALTAAFTYLVLGTIGATFFVIGLGLLYQATGTLNMLDMHERLINQDNRVVRAGFAFIVTGLGLKVAMFPLHKWLPDAYTFAPSAVTAFLASTATKVAVYAMIRFVFTVFGFTFDFLSVAQVFFLGLGLAGMIIASLIAVFRADVKQMLAYSSVAQIGYMLLGISLVEAVAAGGGRKLIRRRNDSRRPAPVQPCVYESGAVHGGGSRVLRRRVAPSLGIPRSGQTDAVHRRMLCRGRAQSCRGAVHGGVRVEISPDRGGVHQRPSPSSVAHRASYCWLVPARGRVYRAGGL